ncbi:MAG: dockerin type I domain-containing protein [Ruminococcus sp.]
MKKVTAAFISAAMMTAVFAPVISAEEDRNAVILSSEEREAAQYLSDNGYDSARLESALAVYNNGAEEIENMPEFGYYENFPGRMQESSADSFYEAVIVSPSYLKGLDSCSFLLTADDHRTGEIRIGSAFASCDIIKTEIALQGETTGTLFTIKKLPEFSDFRSTEIIVFPIDGYDFYCQPSSSLKYNAEYTDNTNVILKSEIFLAGDTNHDAFTDAADYTILIRYLTGQNTDLTMNYYGNTFSSGVTNRLAADVNADGEVNFEDADILFKKLMGEKEPALYGDVNFDGKISISDVIIIQKYILGITELNDEQLAAADINKDGCIDANDIAFMMNIIY